MGVDGDTNVPLLLCLAGVVPLWVFAHEMVNTATLVHVCNLNTFLLSCPYPLNIPIPPNLSQGNPVLSFFIVFYTNSASYISFSSSSTLTVASSSFLIYTHPSSSIVHESNQQ
jgi:hypothetical protein